MHWEYTSICLRFLPKSSGDPLATSGIYLVLKDGSDSIVDTHFITISNLSLHDLQSRYDVYLTTSGLVNETDIKWIPMSYKSHSDLFDKEDYADRLLQSLQFFSKNGFKIIPFQSGHSQDVNYLYNIKVLRLKLSPANLDQFYRANKGNLKRINFETLEDLGSITIESSPFSFTNPALFVNFISQGAINLHIKDSDGTGDLACISDVKYLENMVGGVVKSSSTNSVGLVLGNIRKLNGDGDLTLILSWKRILHGLDEIASSKGDNGAGSQIDLLKANNSFIPGPSNSVVAITVKDTSSNRMFWGSGTIFQNDTIITNDHVVNTTFSNAKIEIHLSRTTKLELEVSSISNKAHSGTFNDFHDQIITPFEDLDLSFIKLSSKNKHIVQTCQEVTEAKINTGSHYDAGDEVSTVGFGLFLSPAISLQSGNSQGQGLQPLSSTGIISSISRFPIFQQSIGSVDSSVPSLIITSSSCWNGSSGGALFKCDTNELLGIICSNAQVHIPSVLLESADATQPKTEKLSKFSLCIPIEVVIELHDYLFSNDSKIEKVFNQKISNAWKLLQTHKEIIVEDTPKL